MTCTSSITLSLIVSPYWTFSWSSCLGNSINVFATQSHVSQRLFTLISNQTWTLDPSTSHCQLSLIFYGFLSPLCDKSLPVWKWMPLKDVPVKQIHPYLNIYHAQNYHVPLCKNETYYPGLPVHRHCPSMDMLECQLRQPNTAELLASQGESHQLWTQQLLYISA